MSVTSMQTDVAFSSLPRYGELAICSLSVQIPMPVIVDDVERILWLRCWSDLGFRLFGFRLFGVRFFGIRFREELLEYTLRLLGESFIAIFSSLTEYLSFSKALATAVISLSTDEMS